MISCGCRLGGLQSRSAERKFARPNFFMYLLYLDDAGSAANRNEEYFVLGGICVYEAQADYFTKSVDQLASTIDSDNPSAVEFHASEIFSRRTEPWKGLDRKDAQGVIKSVLKIVAESYESARLFACAIHKSSFPEEDPVERCFEDICKRFDLFLGRLAREGNRQRGLLILDKTTLETSLQRLARDFRSIGTRWGVVRNLADTPFFVDSKASRLVQIADHVAYSVFRRYNAGDTQYFDVIASRFDSVENVVHGLAHLAKQNASCMCPACLSRRIIKSTVGVDQQG